MTLLFNIYKKLLFKMKKEKKITTKDLHLKNVKIQLTLCYSLLCLLWIWHDDKVTSCSFKTKKLGKDDACAVFTKNKWQNWKGEKNYSVILQF